MSTKPGSFRLQNVPQAVFHGSSWEEAALARLGGGVRGAARPSSQVRAKLEAYVEACKRARAAEEPVPELDHNVSYF